MEHILPLDQYPFESRRGVSVAASPLFVVMNAPISVVIRTDTVPVANSTSFSSIATGIFIGKIELGRVQPIQ